MSVVAERDRVGAEDDSRPILTTDRLSRQFQGVRALDGVSIAIDRGKLIGLIGPNGAGKSTLLSVIAGSLRPTSGRVIFRGRDVTNDPSHKRARAGLIRTFQHASEFKSLTVMENLLAGAPRGPHETIRAALIGWRAWGDVENANIERASHLLDRFQLAPYANTYAGDLSGGQRRLVEIMRALMANPHVLLLDEPMAGVHPKLVEEIGAHLLQLQSEGMTIVLVEHELSVIDALCDPVIVLAEGKLLAQGSMKELRSQAEVVEAYLVG